MSKDPTYCDSFIINHSADIDFDLDWAGIITINANPMVYDEESLATLIERVTDSLEH